MPRTVANRRGIQSGAIRGFPSLFHADVHIPLTIVFFPLFQKWDSQFSLQVGSMPTFSTLSDGADTLGCYCQSTSRILKCSLPDKSEQIFCAVKTKPIINILLFWNYRKCHVIPNHNSQPSINGIGFWPLDL